MIVGESCHNWYASSCWTKLITQFDRNRGLQVCAHCFYLDFESERPAKKKKSACPFSSSTPRQKKATKSFCKEWASKLAESAKGSNYNQEKWLKEDKASEKPIETTAESRFTSFLAREVSFLGREKAKRATKSRQFQRRIKIGQWTFLEVYCSGREAPFCQGSVKLLADDVIWPVTILNDYFRWWSHRFWWRQLPRLLWCRMPLYFLMMISSFWSPELLWRQLYHLRHGVEPLIFFYSVFGWDPLALMFTNVPLSFLFNKIKKVALFTLSLFSITEDLKLLSG